MGRKESGAKKMMLLSKFEGFLGTHICQYCKSYDPIDPHVGRLGHFKNHHGGTGYDYNPYLSMYTASVQYMLAKSH